MVMGLAGLVACGPKGTTEQVASDPFEQIYGSPEQNRRREIRVQKKVRECMVLLGWEYTPVDQGSFTYTEADMARDREQFGYGISTYIGRFAFGLSPAFDVPFAIDLQVGPGTLETLAAVVVLGILLSLIHI